MHLTWRGKHTMLVILANVARSREHWKLGGFVLLKAHAYHPTRTERDVRRTIERLRGVRYRW